MHPFSECPNWEYKDDPHHAQILRSEAAKVLKAIYDGTATFKAAVLDTRGVHSRFFSRLVHPSRAYLAGNYRGSDFKCLRYLSVGIQGNPRVGSPPAVVHLDLKEFQKHAKASIKGLVLLMDSPDARISPKEKLKYLITAACSLFSEFLVIHPYANGNGHMARVALTWILSSFGYWLSDFPIEPRPNEPTYSDAISRYQNGDFEPLERLVLLSIIAGAGPALP